MVCLDRVSPTLLMWRGDVSDWSITLKNSLRYFWEETRMKIMVKTVLQSRRGEKLSCVPLACINTYFINTTKERMLQRSLTSWATVSLCRVNRAVTSKPTVGISLAQVSNPQKCHLMSIYSVPWGMPVMLTLGIFPMATLPYLKCHCPLKLHTGAWGWRVTIWAMLAFVSSLNPMYQIGSAPGTSFYRTFKNFIIIINKIFFLRWKVNCSGLFLFSLLYSRCSSFVFYGTVREGCLRQGSEMYSEWTQTLVPEAYISGEEDKLEELCISGQASLVNNSKWTMNYLHSFKTTHEPGNGGGARL